MFEFLILLALVALNALLSGTEMAVVAARKGKLKVAADRGSRSAALVLALRHDPERFLATVQVGITLVGAIAGAFGGSSLAGVLEPLIARVPGLQHIAGEIAFALVVTIITYLSVVIGELIPKSLALRHAERIAIAMALPLRFLESVASPVVWVLVKSSNILLKPFHDSTNFIQSRLSREDLAAMVSEVTGQSDLTPGTKEVLDRAIEFSSLRLTDVMIDRRSVVSLPATAERQELRRALIEAGHRRVPVYEGSQDNVTGYVLRDDVVAQLWDGTQFELRSLLRPAFFLPEATLAERALQELQKRHLQLVIVVDEHGGMRGIVTLEDLLEELVGEIYNERDCGTADRVRREPDGSWVVQGAINLRDFVRASGLDLDWPDEVRSVGGLALRLAGDVLPAVGARLVTPKGVTFEVLEVSARRVRALRIIPAAAPGADGEG